MQEYIFLKKKILNEINSKSFSIENEIIPNLIYKKKIYGKYIETFFLDIGTENNLKKAKKLIPNFFKKPAVFFDRDGVINYDNNYVYKIKDFRFKKNILKTLKYLIKKKLLYFYSN